MTVTFVAAGALTATITPPAAVELPTGWAAADLFVEGLGNKSGATAVAVLPAQAGWTEPSGGSAQNGTTVGGADTGSTRATLRHRTAVGGDTAPSITASTPVSSPYMGCILALRKTATGAWDLTVCTSGTDLTSTGTDYTAVGGALSMAADDWLVAVTVCPSDLGTSTVFSFTASGMTFGTVVGLLTSNSTVVGNDGRCIICAAPITAGTQATVAPTLTWTGSTGASVTGTTVFIRVREPAAAAAIPAKRPRTLAPFRANYW